MFVQRLLLVSQAATLVGWVIQTVTSVTNIRRSCKGLYAKQISRLNFEDVVEVCTYFEILPEIHSRNG